MRILKYELYNDSTGEYIGSCTVREQQRHAARNYSNQLGVPIKVIAYKEDGETMYCRYLPNGQIEKMNGEVFADPNDPRNYTVHMTSLPGDKVVNLTK